MNKKKETIEELLKKITGERDEYLDGWKRAKAELINSKKEMSEQLGKFSERAEMVFAEDILPVLDALSEAEKSDVEGLLPIKKLMESILKRRGVDEICPHDGEDFDPRYHEAVSGVGHLIKSCKQKGYTYKGSVLRPAKVEVKEEK